MCLLGWVCIGLPTYLTDKKCYSNRLIRGLFWIWSKPNQITPCLFFNVSEGCYRYQPKLSAENERIAQWLIRITTNQRNWGFGLCFLYLRNVKGFGWNHKRVYRIYCELELNMRIKPKKHIVREQPEPLSVPEQKTKVGQWTLCMIGCQMAVQ